MFASASVSHVTSVIAPLNSMHITDTIQPVMESYHESHQPHELTDIAEGAEQDDASSCGSWQDVPEDHEDHEDHEELDVVTVEPIDYNGFFKAAEEGNIEKLQMILDSGAEIELETGNGWTALVLAIVSERMQAVDFLLKRGASVFHRVKSLPPLVHALARGGNEGLGLMKLLVNAGAHVQTISGKDHRNILHWAACQGSSPEMVEYLLSKDLDIEGRCRRGVTPLLVAAECGHYEVIDTLWKHGANINARSENGGTALIWAACHNRVKTAKYLLSRGLDINATDNFGHCVLFLAAHFGNVEMANFLLENGADPHQRTEKSGVATVLHAAACQGHAIIVKKLLQVGCDPTIKTARGNDTLALALAERKEEVVCTLLEAQSGQKYQDTILLQFAMAANHEVIESLIRVTSLVYPQISQGQVSEAYGWLSWIVTEGGELLKGRALNRLLHYALEEHNEMLLKELVNQNCNFNAALESGLTALTFSVRERNVKMVRILVEAGVDVNIQNADGLTALYEAIVRMRHPQDSDIVDLLLKSGTLINKGSSPDSTAFSTVLEREGKEWHELATRMLDLVEDVNEDRDDRGSTLLHVAALRNREDFIDLLLKRDADINTKDSLDRTPFLVACSHGETKTVSYLLKKGADPFTRYAPEATVMHAAATQNRTDNLQFLLDHGHDIEAFTERAYTPLACALTWSMERAAIFLMKKGANVTCKTTRGTTALHFAAKNNLPRAMDELLKRGANIHVNTRDEDGWTPLHEACATGSLEIVNLLLANGADIELEVPEKDRPLHVALINEQEPISIALIEAGACLTVKASKGRSPLHLASEYNLPKAAALLIDRGVSLEDIDDASWSPLCSFGGHQVVDVLLERGANVNYLDRDDWSPLHQAVHRDCLRVAMCLLHAGADMDVRTTDDGLTIYERVEDKEEGEMKREWMMLLHTQRRAKEMKKQ